jgi:hypothetical protein
MQKAEILPKCVSEQKLSSFSDLISSLFRYAFNFEIGSVISKIAAFHVRICLRHSREGGNPRSYRVPFFVPAVLRFQFGFCRLG